MLPRVRALGAPVLPVGRVSGGPIFPEPATTATNPFTRTLLRTWTPGSQPPPAGMRQFLRDATERATTPLLVMVDQAEDLFRGDRATHRRELLTDLLSAPGIHLLFCVRDDRRAALADELNTPPAAEISIAALSPPAALQALRDPLRGTGRTIPPAVAEDLVTDLRTVPASDGPTGDTRLQRPLTQLATVLPWHLQLVATYTWRHWRTGDRALRPADAPRPTQVLSHALWGVISQVAALFDHDPADLLPWLAATFCAPPDQTPHTTLDQVPPALLETLADQSVLRAHRDGDDATYTLHHPRLTEPLQDLARRAGSLTPHPIDPAQRLDAALRALADDDTSRARRLAQQVLTDSPGDPRLRIDAYTVLGNIAAATNLPEAQHAYQSAVGMLEARRDRHAVGTMLTAMGRLELRRGDSAQALGLLRAASARLPGDRMVKTELARALAAAGDPTAAAAILGPVMTAADDDDARILHGHLLAELGRRSQ
nr:tetratricopeptide repeat protein [Actinomadura kijaniata]